MNYQNHPGISCTFTKSDLIDGDHEEEPIRDNEETHDLFCRASSQGETHDLFCRVPFVV